MKRRQFLRISGLASVYTGMSGTLLGRAVNRIARSPVAKDRSKRPNILLIMTDQQFAGAMSCAGNSDLNTPALDSLAAEGMRFEQSYCIQPLSVPSRVGMFTGRYPHQAGAPYNRSVEKGSVPCYMMGKYLADAGYDTGYVGKWHLGIPQSEENIHGFKTRLKIKNNSIDYDIPGGCKTYLKERRDKSKPFFLVASFVNPHDICEWARMHSGIDDELNNGQIPDTPAPENCPELPSNFPIPEKEPDIIRKQQQRSERTYPTVDWSKAKWRQYRWAYNRLTELVDGYIGKLLQSVRSEGLEDDTVIIFVSDHGDGYAAHHWNQKQVLYDESSRVPCIISWKGVTKPGINKSHLVNTGLDILPTLCDYAGVNPPRGLEGRSLRPLAEARHLDSWRNYTVLETEFCGWEKPYGIKGRCVRSSGYKYMLYNEGKIREQLVDMKNDPGEMYNLAFKDEYSDVLNKYRQVLRRWCKEHDDHEFMDCIPES
jgi:choline-sulfatase